MDRLALARAAALEAKHADSPTTPVVWGRSEQRGPGCIPHGRCVGRRDEDDAMTDEFHQAVRISSKEEELLNLHMNIIQKMLNC